MGNIARVISETCRKRVETRRKRHELVFKSVRLQHSVRPHAPGAMVQQSIDFIPHQTGSESSARWISVVLTAELSSWYLVIFWKTCIEEESDGWQIMWLACAVKQREDSCCDFNCRTNKHRRENFLVNTRLWPAALQFIMWRNLVHYKSILAGNIFCFFLFKNR